jgi:hypothetical protein
MKTTTSLFSSALALALAMVLGAATAQAQPQGFDVGKLSLDEAYDPGPLTPGKFSIKAVIDDNDTEGLIGDVLTNTVTVRVEDGGATAGVDKFDVTTTLTRCAQTLRGAVCIDDSSGKRVTAVITRWRNFPDVWQLKLRVRDLTNLDTGFGPLTGPVTVTLTHGQRTRVDGVLATDCKSKKNGARLRCKAN